MYKIMVIEDDPAIREELEVLLKNSLYEPVCPQSFEDPAGQILREAPDLVLLDVNLPGKTEFRSAGSCEMLPMYR